ncbi:orotidine 5'-phosphate decarboxylase [Bifidobacterium dolichotidis]|uniref:Orotidine 5'-phosphate decarboxylase n=1 Tax=Bifidobacterium dolichotidis TaxID=2306976 RepID=A0A430FSX2_9BIFI|nr:orotidine-5'-phosphate decarboxylase [Bifidobacterium dolichotidis]RSX56004.1 orotidine 5'-phosphate decarboxylase [Bifidobacterium dolichotidis]
MDQLIEAIQRTQNPSIIGLDPTDALVPEPLLKAFVQEAAENVDDPAEVAPAARAMAYYQFNCAIIDAIADIVPAVKPQIAMYEALGPTGIDVYTMTCEYAHDQGLYVLGDIKRGDIGSTAMAYAQHISQPTDDDVWHEDAITVNPYLGSDGIEPFVEAAAATHKDVFALVRTSNPSSSQIQGLKLADGSQVYERVADLVSDWGADHIGTHGYSLLGAVVGATHAEQGAALRERMPHTFFLVPGYGAQGGTAAMVRGMFDRNGSGAIVNSSRGVIGAWQKAIAHADHSPDGAGMSVQQALELVSTNARQAAITMRDDLRAVMP